MIIIITKSILVFLIWACFFAKAIQEEKDNLSLNFLAVSLENYWK